jgi:hypothetical protein
MELCEANPTDDSMYRKLPTEAMLWTLFLEDPWSVESVRLGESAYCLDIVVKSLKMSYV